MRGIRSLVCGAFLASTLIPIFAYAAPPTNIYEKLDWNTRSNVANSALGNHYTADPNNKRYEVSPEAYRATRSKKALCGNALCPEDPVEAGLSNLQPDLRRHSVNIYGPMAGFVDTLYSQMVANQLGISLNSPTVLYNTTMMLVEPAVASAVNNSANFALNSVQARLMSEAAFYQGLDSQPDTKQMVMRAYQECVAENMRLRGRGQPTGSPPLPPLDAENDKQSWIQAQSECMADRIHNIKVVYGSLGSSGGTAENFDSFVFAPATGTGEGFDFFHDPSHFGSWDPASITGPDDLNRIYLTDYLFNDSNWAAQGLGWSDVQRMKSDFQTLMGDYLFLVDAQPTGGDRRRSGSRSIKYYKLDPAKNFDYWYGEKFTEIFSNIMTLVKGQCEYNPGPVSAGFNADDLYCSPTRFGTDTFITISMNGYQFDCAMMQMLLNRFRTDFPNVAQGTCGELDPTGPSNPHNLWQAPVQVKSGHRAVAFLASRIAMGQVYATAMQINQVLESLSAQGGSDNFMARFANQLIYSALGSDNYMQDYVSVVNSINDEFRPEIQAQTSKEVGSGSAKLGDTIAESKTAPGTGSMSSKQGTK